MSLDDTKKTIALDSLQPYLYMHVQITLLNQAMEPNRWARNLVLTCIHSFHYYMHFDIVLRPYIQSVKSIHNFSLCEKSYVNLRYLNSLCQKQSHIMHRTHFSLTVAELLVFLSRARLICVQINDQSISLFPHVFFRLYLSLALIFFSE